MDFPVIKKPPFIGSADEPPRFSWPARVPSSAAVPRRLAGALLAGALKARLGVEIPETDYRQIATLDGCVAYLSARV